MRVTIIRPSFGSSGGRSYDTPARMEPLALGVLAALTPRGIGVRLIDERIDRLPLSEPTDLVALSVCTFSAKRAYEISQEYRKRGTKVVMGGFHPTLVPEEAAQYCDSVAIGDAEPIWNKILADFARGGLRPTYGDTIAESRSIVAPDRSLLSSKKYLPIKLIQFGRGCNRGCEFCSVRAFYSGRHFTRPVEEVVAEIRATNAKRFFFVDDNLGANREELVRLLEALIPLGIRWSSQIDLSVADDAGLLRLLAKSGCQTLTLGFESLSGENLCQMGKSWNRADSYNRRLAAIRASGIMIYGTFVFGYDADDSSSFDATLRFAVSQGMMIANFNPLQPLPATPLYKRLEKEERLLLKRWWLSDKYKWGSALFIPKQMTPDELTEGCSRCRDRFYFLSSTFFRLFGSAAHRKNLDNALVFLGSNIISALDIRIKSRLRLGKGVKS